MIGATPRMVFGAGLSTSPNTEIAATQACSQAGAQLGVHEGEGCDLALVFFTAQHSDEADALAAVVRKELRPRHVLGVSCETVVGGMTEAEASAGVSVLAARLPGVTFTPFVIDELPLPESMDDLTELAGAMGATPNLRLTILFADPFSTPIMNMIALLSRAVAKGAGERETCPIFGGMASGATGAGGNVLFLDDRVLRQGAVGLSISGPFAVSCVVSQGCRPIGSNLVVTKAKRNILLELSGKPAVVAVQEAIESLSEEERERIKGGVFLGRVINEYKGHFGRGDYLIRNIVGADQNRGALAVADILHVGQTVRLHVRDARTAHEDLTLLMDAQRLYDKPAGALLVTCNGRGKKLFGTPHHDAQLIGNAFGPARGGEQLAKAGIVFEPRSSPTIPLAGFFGAGEIGPIGSESFLHGHTACVAMFRGL